MNGARVAALLRALADEFESWGEDGVDYSPEAEEYAKAYASAPPLPPREPPARRRAPRVDDIARAKARKHLRRLGEPV